MAYPTNGIVGVDLDATTTSEDFALGTPLTGTDGTEWVFVQASGAITQYDAVAIDENYQAAALTKALADAGHKIGFAQIAFSDNDYGWVACRGSNFNVRLKTSCAPDVALYTTSTAGVLDDTSSSQTEIVGLVAVSSGPSSAATGNAEVIASYPHVNQA